jgi:hypothetical protein
MPHSWMKSVGVRICSERDNRPNKTVRTSRNSQGMDGCGLGVLERSSGGWEVVLGRLTHEVSSVRRFHFEGQNLRVRGTLLLTLRSLCHVVYLYVNDNTTDCHLGPTRCSLTSSRHDTVVPLPVSAEERRISTAGGLAKSVALIQRC